MKIGFDKDGTLQDTLPIFTEVFNDTLAHFGLLPVTQRAIREHYTSYWEEHMFPALGIPTHLIHDIVPIYLEKYKKAPVGKAAPKVGEIIRHITKTYGTAILITNEQTQNTDIFLDETKIRHFFSDIRRPPSRKADCMHDLSVYIGDTIADGRCAYEAGVAFIAVTHDISYNTREALEAFVREDPTRRQTAQSLEELPEIISKLV